MRRPENLEMESEHSCEDNVYANTCDLDVQRMKKTLKVKESPPAKSTQNRAILTLGVLLILVFIALVILTIFLFIYYKRINEEMSHLKNSDKNMEEMTQLKAKYKNTEDAISQLKSNNKNLEDAISQLKRDNKNIEDAISQLKSKANSSCCPKGWIPIGSKCYYFHETEETWERSREECPKHGGVLLILKDKDELDSLLPFMEGDRYWIGLQRDTKNSDRWLWVDGTPLTFSAWDKGEPNNDYGRENCAEIKKNIRSMNDIPCDNKKHYICKALSRG
ncbi:CD209 antigen-like protein C [Rana temporaria]|uniref:CD209 antigen-like protein C n=1 Tax=Rana temporaria TaxID=8407 RepID=UPI001AAD36DD|nr:CD209 antigen-like protein C [Rana temporaria]